MVIEKQCVVSIDYMLKDDDGRVLDSSQGKRPLSYLHGAGNIIPGLESALDGKTVGDQVSAVIPPQEGYGERDEGLVGKVPRANLQGIENLRVGQQLEARTPSGPRVVRVTEVDEESITIDANHPLAGVTLHFDVTITGVRGATPEEVAHSHVHGPDGHPH